MLLVDCSGTLSEVNVVPESYVIFNQTYVNRMLLTKLILQGRLDGFYELPLILSNDTLRLFENRLG